MARVILLERGPEPTGPAPNTTDKTRIAAKLETLLLIHEKAEKRRVDRIKLIAEYRAALGQTPSRDESQRICGAQES